MGFTQNGSSYLILIYVGDYNKHSSLLLLIKAVKSFIVKDSEACVKNLFTAVIVAHCNELECLPLPFTSTLVKYLQARLEPTIRGEFVRYSTLMVVSRFYCKH